MAERTDNKNRKFISGRDILILAVVIMVAVGAIWYMRTSAVKEGNVAIVSVHGQEIMRINLVEYEDKTERISLKPYGAPASLELSEGGIRFVDVECPDHLCEAMGVCRQEYEMAVCLPNATMIAVYAPDDAPNMS